MSRHELDSLILDGTVCECCGEFFDDIINGNGPPGFPRRCPFCEPPRKSKPRKRKHKPGLETTMTTKTKAQRRAESRAAELDRPRREAERAAREADDHTCNHSDVTEALKRAEIDPDRLRSWLSGLFHCSVRRRPARAGLRRFPAMP